VVLDGVDQLVHAARAVDGQHRHVVRSRLPFDPGRDALVQRGRPGLELAFLESRALELGSGK
jgi:hypothetical protein